MLAGALRGLAITIAVLSFVSPAQAALSVLDNGKIRVGVDLLQGGKVTWLSRAQGDRADNLLFEAEQSYYGGPAALDGSPSWHAYQDDAVVVAHSNDGHSIYVRAFSVSCECTMETWITLRGDAVVMRHRLTSFRSDTAQYPPFGQELPAVYTAGAPYRVVTYDGTTPYTRAPVDDVSARARTPFFSPGAYGVVATEHWVALLDDGDFGVGLVEPDLSHFIAISGYDGGHPSGYVAGVRPEMLDANVVFEYTASLVVGSLDQIRTYAYAHRPDPRPEYVFAHHRRHFVEYNATDAGFPIEGALRVRVDQNDPQLIGPEQEWPAARVPRLYVRGAWHTQQSWAELFWGQAGGSYPFSADRVRPFRVVADGTFRTYRVDLFRSPAYEGTITGLRLDPVADGEPGAWVDITCISWRPCPVDRAAERRLLSDRGFVPFLDSFDRLNSSFWSLTGNSTQAAVAVTDGRLAVDVPADAEPLPGQDYVSAGVYSRCTLAGDFTTQVDYDLPIWPDANGVNVNFSVGNRTLFRHNGAGYDGVSSYFPPFAGAYAPTPSPSGSFRFVRTAGLVRGYYRGDQGAWLALDSAPITRDPVNVSLSIFTNRPTAGAQDVQIRFDNFRVTRGRIECP